MTAPVVSVAGYMRKAERTLDEARLLLRDKKTEGSCSRAYYAMHDPAHAALLATGFESPEVIIKTHHSLIAEFGRKLVLGGLIDVGFGCAFNKAQEMLLADYNAEPPSPDEEREAVEQAAAFVAAVNAMIARLKP